VLRGCCVHPHAPRPSSPPPRSIRLRRLFWLRPRTGRPKALVERPPTPNEAMAAARVLVFCAALLAAARGARLGNKTAAVVASGHKKAAVVSSAEVHRVLDVCHSACGQGVDVSCVPSCQDEVHACGTTAGQGAPCEKKAVAKFANFRAAWEKEHPHSFMKVATSALRRKVETGCEDACGPFADSHCFTECETMMFRCMCMEEDIAEKKVACDKCESEVLAKAKTFDERYHTIA
ncbi:unnamed protein product, partial [Prorocentrum cordatum]